MRLGLRALGGVVLILAISTAVAMLVRPFRGEVSGALVLVLGITIAGARLGLFAALTAAAASFLLYNFYFAEPVLQLRLTAVSDFAPLVIFNVSAIIAGLMAGRVREEAEASSAANVSLVTLLDVTQSLQAAISVEDIFDALKSDAGTAAGIKLLPSKPGLPPQSGVGADQNGSASISTEALGGTISVPHLMRIACGGQNIEMIVAPAGLRPEGEAAFCSAIATMVALALERATLSGRVAQAEALARTELLKTTLLSAVSHDLRTPLTTINASASTIIRYGDKLEKLVADELLQTIVDESGRLNRLTGNLLEMTRLESGQPLRSELVSVSDILDAAVRRVQPRLGQRRIERDDGRDCVVLAESSLFELVLMNVLDNAILYSSDSTRIRIALSHDDQTCRIEVADEGRGIPPDELERVFERFHRIHSASESPAGTGLGLAIAKAFVHACGGQISARTPGIGLRGSTISISLPLACGEHE